VLCWRSQVAPQDKPAVFTMFISQLPPKLPNDFMVRILEQCGKLYSWKRLEDAPGRLAKFGFVEFENAQGAQRCMRIFKMLKFSGVAPKVRGGRPAPPAARLTASPQVTPNKETQERLEKIKETVLESTEQIALQVVRDIVNERERQLAEQGMTDFDDAPPPPPSGKSTGPITPAAGVASTPPAASPTAAAPAAAVPAADAKKDAADPKKDGAPEAGKKDGGAVDVKKDGAASDQQKDKGDGEKKDRDERRRSRDRGGRRDDRDHRRRSSRSRSRSRGRRRSRSRDRRGSRGRRSRSRDRRDRRDRRDDDSSVPQKRKGDALEEGQVAEAAAGSAAPGAPAPAASPPPTPAADGGTPAGPAPSPPPLKIEVKIDAKKSALAASLKDRFKSTIAAKAK
jgi:hypothetical protein